VAKIAFNTPFERNPFGPGATTGGDSPGPLAYKSGSQRHSSFGRRNPACRFGHDSREKYLAQTVPRHAVYENGLVTSSLIKSCGPERLSFAAVFEVTNRGLAMGNAKRNMHADAERAALLPGPSHYSPQDDVLSTRRAQSASTFGRNARFTRLVGEGEPAQHRSPGPASGNPSLQMVTKRPSTAAGARMRGPTPVDKRGHAPDSTPLLLHPRPQSAHIPGPHLKAKRDVPMNVATSSEDLQRSRFERIMHERGVPSSIEYAPSLSPVQRTAPRWTWSARSVHDPRRRFEVAAPARDRESRYHDRFFGVDSTVSSGGLMIVRA